MTIRNTIDLVIARSPKEVFEFTVDPTKTPLWVLSVESEEIIGGESGVGAVYRQTVRGNGGEPKELRYRVSEYDPYRRFVLEGVVGDYLPKTVVYTYDPVEGGTRLIYDETIDSDHVPAPVAAGFEEELRSDLALLKQVLESR